MTAITIWTKSYAVSLAERAIATFLESFIAAAGLDAIAIGVHGWDGINWGPSFGIASAATLLAIIKGIIGNAATKDGPSLTHHEQVKPELPNLPQS